MIGCDAVGESVIGWEGMGRYRRGCDSRRWDTVGGVVDGMGCDCDGMGQDEMGWKWDGTRCDAVGCDVNEVNDDVASFCPAIGMTCVRAWGAAL